MNSTPPPVYDTPTPPPDQRQVEVAFHVDKSKPWATYILMGVTILIYGVQVLTQYLFNYDIPSLLGAKVNSLILQGEVWRLITPVFLHGSILHIGFNMYALFTIGPGLEKFYGKKRYLLLYFIGGYCGNVLSFLFTSGSSIGASTAIFALVSAEIIFIYRNKILFGNRTKSMLINLAFVVIVNLAFGLAQSGIDNWGHLGGLLSGFLFSWFAGPHYKIQPGQMGLELKDVHSNHEILWGTLLSAGLFTAIVIGRFLAG